jgi:hypothetical protein
VKDQIPDESRRTAAANVISRWSSDVRGFLEQSRDRQQALARLMPRHDAMRPELTAALSDQAAAAGEMERHVLDDRFALKQQPTREERGRALLPSIEKRSIAAAARAAASAIIVSANRKLTALALRGEP